MPYETADRYHRRRESEELLKAIEARDDRLRAIRLELAERHGARADAFETTAS